MKAIKHVWPLALGSPVNLIVSLGLIAGVLICFLTPPFQVPDEHLHFFRAYSLSEGHLTAKIQHRQLGQSLPRSLVSVGFAFADIRADSELTVSLRRIWALFRVPLVPDDRLFVAFPNTAVYPFVAYIPQAAAIALGRALGSPPLVLLYLARIANVITACLVLALAGALSPTLRWFTALIVLAPMSLFLRSSVSADSLTLALAFLAVAASVRFTRDRSHVSGRAWGLITLSSTMVCLTKLPYVPLAVLPIVLTPSFTCLRRRLPFIAVHVLLVTLACIYSVSVATVDGLHVHPDRATAPDLQLALVAASPARFGLIAASDYLRNGARYGAEMIGRLGWLDVPLPVAFLVFYGLLALSLALFENTAKVHPSVSQRLLLVLVALSAMGLVSLSQYVVWTPYGAAEIVGIQGRYLLPLSTVVAWTVLNPRLRGLVPGRTIQSAATYAVFASALMTAYAIVDRYYI